MISNILAAVIAALAVLAAAGYTVRATKKAQSQTAAAAKAIAEHQQQVDAFRADGEAYDRAMKFNERIVAGLADELDRVRTRLAAEEARSDDLEKQVEELQKFADRATRLLSEHNIPLPARGI